MYGLVNWPRRVFRLRAEPAEAMTLARQYPPECMRIVQEGLEKEDRLAA